MFRTYEIPSSHKWRSRRKKLTRPYNQDWNRFSWDILKYPASSQPDIVVLADHLFSNTELKADFNNTPLANHLSINSTASFWYSWEKLKIPEAGFELSHRRFGLQLWRTYENTADTGNISNIAARVLSGNWKTLVDHYLRISSLWWKRFSQKVRSKEKFYEFRWILPCIRDLAVAYLRLIEITHITQIYTVYVLVWIAK